MTRLCLALVVIAGIPGAAGADVPGPHDELCTIEKQQQDGSSCRGCSYAGFDPAGTRGPCDELAAQGLFERCSIGATHVQVIYCDRQANWIAVGSGEEAPETQSSGAGADSSTCGCRAPGGRSRSPMAAALLLAAAAIVAARRRSC